MTINNRDLQIEMSRCERFCKKDFNESYSDFYRIEIAGYGIVATVANLVKSAAATAFIILDTVTFGQIDLINRNANKNLSFIHINPLTTLSVLCIKTINPKAKFNKAFRTQSNSKIEKMLESPNFAKREVASRVYFFAVGIFNIFKAPFQLALSPLAILLAVGCLGKNKTLNTWVIQSFANANIVLIALQTLRLVVNPHAVYKVARREDTATELDNFTDTLPVGETIVIPADEKQQLEAKMACEQIGRFFIQNNITDTCAEHVIMNNHFFLAPALGPSYEEAKGAYKVWSTWISKYISKNNEPIQKQLDLIARYFEFSDELTPASSIQEPQKQQPYESFKAMNERITKYSRTLVSFQGIANSWFFSSITETCDQHRILNQYFTHTLGSIPSYKEAKEAYEEWSTWINKYIPEDNEYIQRQLRDLYLYFNPPIHEGVPLD